MIRHARTTTSSGHGVILAVVCLALAAVVAAMASLNVALPSIARDTHASETELVWVIDAYSLAFAALLLPAGGIGDRYGRRIALILGLSIFGGGSAIVMTATSASELIALRAVIGLGAALVMPATLSTITSTFPASKRARAVSVWAAVAGGAAVIGLLASGLLLAGFSWRSIFALNVLLSVLALVGTLRFVPESADPHAPRLDFAGAAIAVAALGALVFSIIEAPTHGWLATRTIAGLALAVVLVAAFVVWELRQDAPLLNPRVFRQRPLSAGSMSIFVQFFAFYGYSFVTLQYLQLVRGDTALLAALYLLPTAAAMIPAARLAPRLAQRFGSRTVCAAGLVLIASGLAIVAQLGTHTPYWHMAVGLVLLGAGMGAAMTPATTAITEALPSQQQRRRFRAQRPLARGRRRDRDRRHRKHPHRHLQQPHQHQRPVNPDRHPSQELLRDREPDGRAHPRPSEHRVRQCNAHLPPDGGRCPAPSRSWSCRAPRGPHAASVRI